MASAKLTAFAAGVNAGMGLGEAARAAGYADTTARSGTPKLLADARAAGLILKPEAIQDAIAIIEEGLPDLAREIVAIGRGERPKHRAQLDAIREAFDRTRGRPKQGHEVTGAGGGPVETRIVITWPEDDRDGDDGG